MSFHANYRGIGEMLCSDWMVDEMHRRAERAKVLAEIIAPVDPDSPHAGRYKASFHVESGVQHRKTSRAYDRLINDAPEAFFVEYGTKNNPAHHVMMKALDALRG
jgi:hypothetical protein